VVLTCPACRLEWLETYAPRLPDVRLLHITELMTELIAAGKLPLRDFAHTVTYHDPCDLARTGGVYEAPRQVLHAIPGIELREVNERRESGLCCGGGGDVEMVAPDMVRKVGAITAAKMAEPGAEVLATACPQCMRVLEAGLKSADKQMEVLDIMEILAKISLDEA